MFFWWKFRMNTGDGSEVSTSENMADSAVLTASAFQFLLWNRRIQLWFFIIQLLEYSQVGNFLLCFDLQRFLKFIACRKIPKTFPNAWLCCSSWVFRRLAKLIRVKISHQLKSTFYKSCERSVWFTWKRYFEVFQNAMRPACKHNYLKRKEKRFYPTRMTIQIANGLNDYEESHQDNKGFIVVETNYRIYAYTSNSWMSLSNCHVSNRK